MNKAVAAYMQARVTNNPLFEAAYQLQESIKERKKKLDDDTETLKRMMKELAGAQDKCYRVQGTRTDRILDLKLVKENHPEAYKLAKPSDKFIVAALAEVIGWDKILEFVRENNPKAYEENLKLTLAEFDKATGDSSSKKKFVGSAYRLEVVPRGEAYIEYISPMMQAPKHEALAEGSDFE